jgi:hypothetical protein
LPNKYDLSDLVTAPSGNEAQNYNLADLSSPTSQKEMGLPQQAAILGKSATAGALGAIPDIASMIYNIPAMVSNYKSKLLQQAAERYPESLEMIKKAHPEFEIPHAPLIPSATEAIEHGIDIGTGGYTETPKEGALKHIAEGAKFAGSLAGPGGVAKAAEKFGAPLAAKAIGAIGATKPSELVGAGTAGTGMSMAQEDLGPLGALGVGLVSGAGAQKAASGLSKVAKAPGEETIGRVLSLRAKPNENLIKEAKEAGVDLPFNVKLDSDIAHLMANSALKGIATSKKYKDTIKKADQSMINAVVKNIESIHPEKLGKEEASQAYREQMHKTMDEIQKESSQLYDKARTHLQPTDVVAPSHTINAMKDLRSKLSADVPSSDMKFMLKKLSDLEDAWGLKTPSLERFNLGKELTPQKQQILAALGKSSSVVPLDKLVQQRSAFMRDIQYGEEAKGAKGFMNSLIGAIDKDIASTSNKDFLNNWRAANQYFKEEVADKIRTDFAESLSKKEMPKLAYSFMNTPERINELHKIIGDSPASKQVMQALKRSKLQETVIDRVMNSDGTLSYANLANLFNKKSPQQGMLKSLLGKEAYENMQKLGNVAAAQVKAGKTLANPSGTAITQQEFKKIGAAMGALLGAGIGTGHALASVGTAAGLIGTPYVISRMLANPKYVDSAVKFATARQHNKLKDASKYQTYMRQIFLKQIAPQLREVAKPEKEE